VRAEADIDANRLLQAAQKESRGAEQNDDMTICGHHKNIAQAQAAAGAGESIFAFQCAG